MRTLHGRRVFTAGTADYCWEDVALAAVRWGDWARLDTELRQGLACLERADEAEEPADPDQVEAAASEFRYARDLVAAEEARAWLAEWGLTAEEWMSYIRRSVLRRQWSAELADIAAHYTVSDQDVAAALKAEAICSGHLARVAGRLAGYAAIYAKVTAEAGHAPGAVTQGELGALRALSADVPECDLPGLCAERSQERVEHLARLEACFRRFRGAALTPKALAAEVGVHQIEWIRVDCRYLAFPVIEAAREAALCVKEDGRDLTEVAADAGTCVRQARWYLDELPPAVRGPFLAARTGDLLEPLPFGDEVRLCLVLGKAMPSADDPDVRRLAEERLITRLVEPETASRVRWHVRW